MPVTKKGYNEKMLLTYTLFDQNKHNKTSLKYPDNIYKPYF